MDQPATYHRLFGLRVRADFPLPELPPDPRPGPVDVDVVLADAGDVAAAFSGSLPEPVVATTVLGDGRTYRTERGIDGDYRIAYGDEATFHLGGGRLRCAPRDVDHPRWRRFLLDSAMGSAALVHGYDALHAGAVVGPGGVVAVVTGEGGGKSTLVVELLRRGATLFCDDVLCLSRDDDGAVIAHPGPPLMNLPPSLPDGGDAADVGRTLAVVDGEAWVAVPTWASQPAAVGAVVHLDRADHGAIAVEAIGRSPAPLLAASLLSGVVPERLARRFELLGDLAETVRQFRVTAPLLAPASVVADAVTRAVLGHDS